MNRDKWGHYAPYRKWYSSSLWKNLRLRVLSRDPICKICNRAPSVIADHIKDHKGIWALFVDILNIQGLCKKCHDEKTGLTSHAGQSPEDKLPKATIVGDAVLDAALASYECQKS